MPEPSPPLTVIAVVLNFSKTFFLSTSKPKASTYHATVLSISWTDKVTENSDFKWSNLRLSESESVLLRLSFTNEPRPSGLGGFIYGGHLLESVSVITKGFSGVVIVKK